MERRLSGILAGDVVGYSRLMEENEADTFNRVRLQRTELFEPKIVEHRGRIFKLMGDGLLAEFASVVDAVECAASLQREMAIRNNGLAADRRIDVRIGVHLGDVIVEGEDRFGDAVNIAARLEQLANPGGIAVSQTVLDHVGNKVAIGFEFVGEHHVKNILKPIVVYRVKLDHLPSKSPGTIPKAIRKKTLTISLVVVALLAGLGALFLVRWQQFAQLEAFSKSSIAVLPFTNIGNDPKWGRFADGITEDIITDLAHSRALSVIARNSTEVYKGRANDIRKVGKEVGAKYVLEGSIEPMAETIRVTAQLIEANTGTHVWSKRFDGPTSDVFLVQNEVTERIAAAISGYEGAVAQAERELLHRKAPRNLDAFDYYLLGMESKHALTKEGFLKAEILFHKAIELDPQLARAYVGLAETYTYIIDNGFAPLGDTLEKLMDAAQKAVSTDPSDGQSQLVLGLAFAYRGELAKASTRFALAEELAPNDADLLVIYAWNLPSLGDPERGLELSERAVKLNPFYPDWYIPALRTVYFFAKNFRKSEEFAKQVKEPFANDYAFLAMSSAYLGKSADAKRSTENVLRMDASWNAEGWISSQGGFAREQEANLVAHGAEVASLPMCFTTEELKTQVNVLQLEICNRQRAATTKK